MSRRINQDLLRRLYLLVSECRELGSDGIGWRRHMVDRLAELLDADMVLFADNLVVGPPGSDTGWIRPVSIIDHWPSETERSFYWDSYIRDGRHEHTPMARLAAGHSRVRVASRRDLVHDDRNYVESDYYQRYMAPIGMNDLVHSVSRTSEGVIQMLTLQRGVEKPDFPRWVVHWLRALWIELRKMQPHDLKDIEDSVFTTLPRRRLQILACLLAGSTVREAAEMLGISIHTAQEHVKRLYRDTGAKSRTELASCFRDVTPVLVAMPLSQISDMRSEIDRATRSPWPLEPSTVSPCLDTAWEQGLQVHQ